MMNKEKHGMQVTENQRQLDATYHHELSTLWESSDDSTMDKLKAFTKYVPYTEFPKLFSKYEMFKRIVNVHGAIVECGVHQGTGVFTWSILSTMFEPVNHIRKVIGFDTFAGLLGVDQLDKQTGNVTAIDGSLSVNSFETLSRAVEIFDMARPLGHIRKVELIRGDACETIPKYLVDNPHLVVALLYLDFDIFKPTKVALEVLRPRMPKGAIIAFDELYVRQWPGETIAVMDVLGISNLRIERFPFHPQISYVVLE